MYVWDRVDPDDPTRRDFSAWLLIVISAQHLTSGVVARWSDQGGEITDGGDGFKIVRILWVLVTCGLRCSRHPKSCQGLRSQGNVCLHHHNRGGKH